MLLLPKNSMIKKLIKIGGALVNSRDNFIKLLELIKNEDYNDSFFVISGFGKTTHKLKLAAVAALNSLDFATQAIYKLLEELSELSPIRPDFESDSNQLLKIIKGIYITKELTPKLLDKILAFGEILSLNLIKINIDDPNIHFVNAEELITTDSNFNNANPNIAISKRKATTYIEANKYPKYITQGFIAADINGNRTTMGFESSNLTATLLADIFKLKQVLIITDVNGIRNIDPKIASNNTLISNLNYSDALQLANYGLKQLYPKMIKISEINNIEIIFRSIDNQSQVTKINSNNSDNTTILILNRLNDIDKKPDIYYYDNNFSFSYQRKGYKSPKSQINQYILYNVDIKQFLKYFIDNFDMDNLLIDNYGNNVFKIISKNDSTIEIKKLTNYINNN